MKKIPILIIVLMMVSIGFLSGCNEDRQSFKITVMNDHRNTVYVQCMIYYNATTSRVFYGGKLESKSTYNLNISYEKSQKIDKILIATYNSSEYGKYRPLAYEFYEFPDSVYFNLLGVINESGNTITIEKQ